MSRKNKFYIPLVTIKGSTKWATLINAEKIPDVKELIPPVKDIMMNLVNQRARMARGKEFSPLRIKVSKEKFQELENQIRLKKPGHVFVHKAFDIISDTRTKLAIVQIISI